MQSKHKKEKRRVTVKLKLIGTRVGQIGIEPREKNMKNLSK